MTRKRFIKLLMSEGLSRNEAVDYACTFRRSGLSYSRMYIEWLINRDDPAFSAALTQLMEAAVEAIGRLAQALGNMDFSGLVENITSFEE